MNSTQSQKDDIRVIREIMEKSSRFLSLSGLSGIIAGIYAIAGAAIAWLLILNRGFEISDSFIGQLKPYDGGNVKMLLVITALLVLVAAVVTAFLLSAAKAKKSNQKLWSPVTAQMLYDMALPLVAGGIFAIFFLWRGDALYIIPAMLVFYGLALTTASHYTFGEVKYLGISEIITGLVALAFPGYGLLFWIAGFGILHIAYGSIIQRKYH